MSFRGEVPLPRNMARLNSVQPDPILGTDGFWYLAIEGSLDGGTYRQYMFKWKPGVAVAERVPLQGETDARGSVGLHSAGAVMFSWEGSGSFPRLIYQDVPGLIPAPLDSRIDAILMRLDAIDRRLDAAGAQSCSAAPVGQSADRAPRGFVRAVHRRHGHAL